MARRPRAALQPAQEAPTWGDFWRQLDARARELPETRKALWAIRGEGVRFLGVLGGGLWVCLVHAYATGKQRTKARLEATNGPELVARVQTHLGLNEQRRRGEP